VDDVRKQLAEVAEGKRFLLQGGDCAERFVDCNSGLIENKLRILLQMSLVLTWGARMPTLRIGRMAGQYSKPRSSDTEVVDGVGTVCSYRGENVNGYDPKDRTPDPSRLLLGYFHSAATLNYVRSLLDSGFSDLHCARGWELDFVKDPAQKARYEQLTKEILSALDFMRVVGGNTLDGAEAVRRASIFASHEGLHLPFETAMTRHADSAASIWDKKADATDADTTATTTPAVAAAAAAAPAAASAGRASAGPRWYNLGAHFLWIGDRTRALDGAHIEYFRGIANPIGIKVGPSMKRAELVPLIRMLWPNPADEPGKIVLITRLGAGKVRDKLPGFVRAVQAANLPVVWTCDLTHGYIQINADYRS
jgi:3-deoxy-7-phosphoheptulonate synthase